VSYRFGDQLFAGAIAPTQGIPVLPQGAVQAAFLAPNDNGGVPTSPIFDPHHYARLNGEQIFTLAVTTSELIAPRTGTLRNMLFLRNASGAADVYVSFGNAASLNSILKLAAGDQILLDAVVPQDDIFAYSTVGGAQIVVASSTTPGKST
jgi:hypothetical protein